jgi:hypothetical protein
MPCVIVVTSYNVPEGESPKMVVGPFDMRELAEAELRNNDWKRQGSKWLNAGMWAFVCSISDAKAFSSLVVSVECKPGRNF